MAVGDRLVSLIVGAADRLIGASGAVSNAAGAVRRDAVAATQRHTASEAVRRAGVLRASRGAVAPDGTR